jgi:hypothetical protein
VVAVSPCPGQQNGVAVQGGDGVFWNDIADLASSGILTGVKG